MKIRFSDQARRDLEWFFTYYHGAFPSGLENAKKGFFKTIALLHQSPFIGHLSEDSDVREFLVLRTPFQFIYRVDSTEVYVLRVWDSRSKRPKKWT